MNSTSTNANKFLGWGVQGISTAKKTRGEVEEGRRALVEVLSKALNNPLSREDEVELHLKLAEKYLCEAEDLLAKGDYIEASEKGWGAVV